MKSDKESLLSVSRVAMKLPELLVTAGRADDEPAGSPPEAGAQDEGDVRNYTRTPKVVYILILTVAILKNYHPHSHLQ